MSTVSPLAPDHFPEMPAIDGIKLAVAATGARYKGRDDLMLMLADDSAVFAGMFTKSATASAPVQISREGIKTGHARAVLTNAGNANAFTGKKGVQAIAAYRTDFAEKLNIQAEQILIASTGVIGLPLNAGTILQAQQAILDNLGQASWHECAEAIKTTDTFAKGATTKINIHGQTVTINGIAKGSGMIAPDMATMLAYIATDAAITQTCLQQMLVKAGDISFNAITVDSDTSTSDSVYLVASQKANHPAIQTLDSPEGWAFYDGLAAVMTDLAQQIVRDGEGASKFITVHVKGAMNNTDAKIIALSIANSPLVKTAIAGEDANWGRIVMAVGKSGATADRDKLRISIGGILIAADGEAIDEYDEAPVAQHMKGQNININVDLALGTGAATIWTCDLTHGYITINGDYRS